MLAPRSVGRLRECGLAAVVALILTLVFMWPLAARFSSGGRIDGGDGRWSIWAVSWVAHALTSDPTQLWHANIFYPSAESLAYSDPNIIGGILAIPAWLLTKNPYAASNFSTMCAFLLAFVWTFALVRRLSGQPIAAGIAATLFTFNSFTFSHLAHSQLLMTFGIPMSCLALHSFVEARTVARAARLGLALAVTGLSCGYYGVFMGLAIGFGLIWFGVTSGEWRHARYWVLTGVAGACALAIVLPFVWPLLSLNFSRSIKDAEIFHAGWRAYLASGLVAYDWMLPLIGSWREVLFPGFLSIGLTILVIVQRVRFRGKVFHVPHATVWFYVALAVLAFWASLGPDAGLYRVLFRAMPFMSLIRAASRFGILVIFAFAVIAGVGVAQILERTHGRKRIVVAAAFVMVALARSFVSDLHWPEARPTSPVYTWLARMPRGVTAEFPFYSSRKDGNTWYMLNSAWHWQPLLNGYSDYVPEWFDKTAATLETFPSQAAIELLRSAKVRYVVVHWKDWKETTAVRDVHRSVEELGADLRPMLNDQDASLFEVLPARVIAMTAAVGK